MGASQGGQQYWETKNWFEAALLYLVRVSVRVWFGRLSFSAQGDGFSSRAEREEERAQRPSRVFGAVELKDAECDDT